MASIPQGAFATYKIRANANKGGWQDKKDDEDSKGWSWGKKTPKENKFTQFPQECKITAEICSWIILCIFFSTGAATSQVQQQADE